MHRSLTLAALLGSLAWGADPAPEITAAGVVRGVRTVGILVPGADGMSIYGRHLGPDGGCVGTANPTYPTELCGTQVLIGDRPAELLYVSEKQINFKVPQDSPENGTVDLRVVFKGQSSAPLIMQVGFEKTTVSLDQPAHTDMPVWLKVELPFQWGSIRYPFVLGPAGFGCNEVEVRRNGTVLDLLPGSNWARHGMTFSGNICGSYALPSEPRAVDRLPLHLLYRFDTPGTYEVRFTLRTGPSGMSPQAEIRAQSEWTPIEILPSNPRQRAECLDALRQRAQADTAEILPDVLPSVLGLPDEASLEIVTGYLYHPNSSVRRYALNGLSYWPEDSTSHRLLALLHTKGPSDELVQFLIRQPEFLAAHAAEIEKTSLPFLASDSPVLIDGAIMALRQAPPGNPALLEAMLRSGGKIAVRADVQGRGDLLEMMAATKDERVHTLLRKLVEDGHDLVIHALASFRDSNDLSRLGAILNAPVQGGGDRLIYLPELLYQTFGNAAVPYLESALRGSPGRFTLRNIASQLMAAGDPAGFQYALSVMDQKGALRTDIVEAMKNRFPELKDANDDTIRSFLKARAGN